MLGNHITWAFHIPGTLAANANIRWAAPVDCNINHVSAVASNDSDATLDLGISSNTDSILDGQAVGDSGVPATFDRDDFASTNETGDVAKDEVLVLTVDYDGAAGTAAANLTVIITATEG